MALSDFLFQGQPPPSVTTYGSTTQNLPAWYNDYLQATLAKGNSVADEGYQPYDGPRVAGFGNDERAAFDATRSKIGSVQPYMDGALWMNEKATGVNPLDYASPYMNKAGQSAADVVGGYMNPYNSAVTDRIGELAGRNLRENLMPAIGDTFTKAGQFGSSRQQEAVGKAMRDTQESALAAQSKVLQEGYGQAMGAAQSDLARYGNIGQTMGNLGSAYQQNMTNAGTARSNIASAYQGMNLKDAAALQSIGQIQRQFDQGNLDTAYGDFLEQRDYPKTQLGFMSNLARGFQIPMSSSTANTGPASSYGASPLASLASGLGGLSALMGTTGKARGGRVSVKPKGGKGGKGGALSMVAGS